MYRVTINFCDCKCSERVYTVGKKQKDFLVKALSKYDIKVEKIIIEE